MAGFLDMKLPKPWPDGVPDSWKTQGAESLVPSGGWSSLIRAMLGTKGRFFPPGIR